MNSPCSVDGEACFGDLMVSEEGAEGLEGFAGELAFRGSEGSVFDDEDGGVEEFVEPAHGGSMANTPVPKAEMRTTDPTVPGSVGFLWGEILWGGSAGQKCPDSVLAPLEMLHDFLDGVLGGEAVEFAEAVDFAVLDEFIGPADAFDGDIDGDLVEVLDDA